MWKQQQQQHVNKYARWSGRTTDQKMTLPGVPVPWYLVGYYGRVLVLKYRTQQSGGIESYLGT